MSDLIEVEIPLFPDRDEWADCTIESFEVSGDQWGVNVKCDGMCGAYYFTRKHPSEWTERDCAVAIQSALDHRFMMDGPPTGWTKDDIFEAADRLLSNTPEVDQ